MSKFPIGFWNYTDMSQPVNADPVRCVQEWADAGTTLTMSPNYESTPEQVERMRAILDAAHAHGIQVILGHAKGYWPHLSDAGEEAYRRDFARAARELGDHPAVFGFHVGDEPGVKEFSDACRALRIQKEMAPALHPFLNMLPWFQGIEPRIGFSSCAEWLDTYVRDGNPAVLCYDCYAQMNPHADGDGYWGREMYFENLREFHAAGARHQRPFWTTLLSVGHFRYQCPTENDLRWQLNTAVAHGAQGILWFFFYMRKPHDNYRVAPVDEHWERTETFQWMSRVNRTFLRWQAPVVQQLALRRVYHVNKSWAGFKAPDGTGMVAQAGTDREALPLVVSEFKHENGADYVMMVNNSQRESVAGSVRVQGRQPKAFRVDWGALEVPAAVDEWHCQQGVDDITLRAWLAPGQMELYRIEQTK